MRVLLFLLPLLFLVGCVSQRGVRTDDGSALARVEVRADGRIVGSAPGTVRIRREFEIAEITVVQNDQIMRILRLEQFRAVQGGSLNYTFSGNNFGGTRGFNIEDLPIEDGAFIVPYTQQTLRIEDQDYGLTLLIQ